MYDPAAEKQFHDEIFTHLTVHDLASGMVGAIIKDPAQDPVVFKEYLETVIKERDGWKDLYRACRERI